MTNENVPCQNPSLCGVQTHRPHTHAKCGRSTSGPNHAGGVLSGAVQLSSRLSGRSNVLEFDSDNYADVDVSEDEVIESLNVQYIPDAEDYVYYQVNAEASINFFEHLPSDWDEDRSKDFLDENQEAVRMFLVNRYGIDAMNGDDWDYQRVTFTSTIVPESEDDPITDMDAVDTTRSQTKIVQMYNELDPGTFGSENFERLLKEELKIVQ